MHRERLDQWCERGILALVIGILIIGPLANGANRENEFILLQFLTVGVLALWMVRFWTRSGYRFLWPPIAWAVMAFAGYAIVSYQFAPIEYAARLEVVKIITYAVLFFAILDNLNRQEFVQRVVFVLVFLAMAISFYAVAQFLTKADRIWHLNTELVWIWNRPGYLGRASGTYICPNSLAGFLVMVLPVGLAFTICGRFSALTKVFLGYACLVIACGIAVTLSRGGWLAAGISVCVFLGVLIHQRIYRIPSIVFLVLLIGGSLFFIKKTYSAQRRVERVFNPDTGKIADDRLHLWAPTVQVWREDFWWGAGPAHFDHRFRQFRPDRLQVRPEFAHNDYLNTLADYGLVGTGIVVGAWTLLALGALKTWKFVRRGNDLTSKPSNRAAFALGAGTGLLALLLHSVVDFDMHVPANAVTAITLLSLLSGHLRYATERYWVNPRILGRILAMVLLSVALVYLAREGFKRARERHHLMCAELKGITTDTRLESLKQAFAIDPLNYDTAYEIGETLRLLAWRGYDGYEALATEAMKWFSIGWQLNPISPYNYARYGMCLHWLNRHDETEPYFRRALDLDPNSHYMLEMMGWHFFQLGEYERAQPLFKRARALLYGRNEIAITYLKLIDQQLKERAKSPPR